LGLGVDCKEVLPISITVDVINDVRYALKMIVSFKNKEAEKIFSGRYSRRLPEGIQRIAARKLEQINAATMLETLRIPPGNRL